MQMAHQRRNLVVARIRRTRNRHHGRIPTPNQLRSHAKTPRPHLFPGAIQRRIQTLHEQATGLYDQQRSRKQLVSRRRQQKPSPPKIQRLRKDLRLQTTIRIRTKRRTDPGIQPPSPAPGLGTTGRARRPNNHGLCPPDPRRRRNGHHRPRQRRLDGRNTRLINNIFEKVHTSKTRDHKASTLTLSGFRRQQDAIEKGKKQYSSGGNTGPGKLVLYQKLRKKTKSIFGLDDSKFIDTNLPAFTKKLGFLHLQGLNLRLITILWISQRN